MTEQTIHQAYVAAMSELANPKKNQTADTGRFAYSYADLAQIIDMTRPVLAKHNLVAVQDIQMTDGQMCVWTYILHSSGDQITFGPIVGRTGSDWQQLGAAITYSRRYSLMAALGLAAEGEDTDGAVNGKPVQRVSHSDQAIPDDPWQTPEPVALVEAELGGVVLVPNNIGGPLARKMIRNGSEPATDRQLEFVRKLAQAKADELGQDPITVVNSYLSDVGLAVVEKTGDMTKGQASAFIEAVKS